MFKRILLFLAVLFLLSSPVSAAEKPNFLIILTDDQRYDMVGQWMPIVQSRIFDQGATFPHTYITTPLCCPSRASILTGRYAHNTGVRQNSDQLLEPTFVNALHDTGYKTGMVGKYLNSWHDPRPEFDFWVGIKTKQQEAYLNPRLIVNGTQSRHKGYITWLLRDYTLQFLKETQEPFFLLFAPIAPHKPALSAKEHERLYRRAKYNPPADDISDKPRWVNQEGQSTDMKKELYRKMLQSLKAVDESVGDVLNLLEQQGRLDSTVVIFLSDNGFLLGEHGLWKKNVVYEEAVRVPFAIRYPPLISPGTVDNRLVANIDIAPTFYHLAGLPIPEDVDGLPLFAGGEWRDHLFLEGWPEGRPWRAVHTGQNVYVETEGDISEFYDLAIDPYQLENRIQDPTYAEIIQNLQSLLE